jgi:hypothetical protein
MLWHKFQHQIFEVLVLSILVIPLAILLGSGVGITNWVFKGHEAGLISSGMVMILTIAVTPLALRTWFGPDTSAICEECIVSRAIGRRTEACKAPQQEKRRYPRYQVKCSTTMFNERFSSFAIVQDISQGGCKIQTRVPVAAGELAQLLITLPGLQAPVKVSKASVRWVAGNECGLQFLALDGEAQNALRRLPGSLNDQVRII